MDVTTTGKWILAGEHSALRGCSALVFPLKTRTLTLNFTPGAGELTAVFQGEHGTEQQLLFWAALEKACELSRVRRSLLTGKVTVTSNLPVGAGLGASAALSVAMTRWWEAQGWVATQNRLEFARELENLFHGESSGLDIAVVDSGKGLIFQRERASIAFEPNWKPRLRISYSGKRGVTAECVRTVKDLWDRNPQEGARLDERMQKAVRLAQDALMASDESKGLMDLVESMNLGAECFASWGLADGPLKVHQEQLRSAGALATKPTGSGLGGYVLSLWRGDFSMSEVSPELSRRFIDCW